MTKKHLEELLQGDQFQFSTNWEAFLNTLNDEHIYEAEHSLKEMLGVDNLSGKSFLDIGSGGGLFSLVCN